MRKKDDLHAGRVPQASTEGLQVKDLVNRFLTVKKQQVDLGELAQRSYADYYRTCELLFKELGRSRPLDNLGSDDFERLRSSLAKTRGPVALGNEIQRVRVVFKYGYDARLQASPPRPAPLGKTEYNPSNKVASDTACHMSLTDL